MNCIIILKWSSSHCIPKIVGIFGWNSNCIIMKFVDNFSNTACQHFFISRNIKPCIIRDKTLPNEPWRNPALCKGSSSFGKMLLNNNFSCTPCGKKRQWIAQCYVTDMNEQTGSQKGIQFSLTPFIHRWKAAPDPLPLPQTPVVLDWGCQKHIVPYHFLLAFWQATREMMQNPLLTGVRWLLFWSESYNRWFSAHFSCHLR